MKVGFGSSFIVRQGVAKKTRTTIQLHNNSIIAALPCSENLLRGYMANLIICDEAAFTTKKTIAQVMFPMLSAKAYTTTNYGHQA